MKKLLICAALFFAPLTACEWTNVWEGHFDYDKECLFYDAWNDAIVYDVPDSYMKDMFDYGRSVVITHFVKVEKPVNIFFDERTIKDIEWLKK
jgi:hypothetical protein